MLVFMDRDHLETILKEWKSEPDDDDLLLMIEELKEIEQRHRQVIHISSDLEGAYHHVLQKIQ
jgi:hypothetical protein